MGRPKFIASVSFGKDSLATILLAKEHGEPDRKSTRLNSSH